MCASCHSSKERAFSSISVPTCSKNNTHSQKSETVKLHQTFLPPWKQFDLRIHVMGAMLHQKHFSNIFFGRYVDNVCAGLFLYFPWNNLSGLSKLLTKCSFVPDLWHKNPNKLVLMLLSLILCYFQFDRMCSWAFIQGHIDIWCHISEVIMTSSIVLLFVIIKV